MVWSFNVPGDKGHPFQKQNEKLEEKLKLSGGETQREVVASRTFMHLNSGEVKFVAVDEPWSALDPEAEQNLFERLLAERKGKTMVTHRFAHLTKHPDLIICMKEGSLIEMGNLMQKDGEYKKLYNIQANSFLEM